MPSTETSAGSRRGRRNDPERREKIIDACLDVIAEAGVAGVSHRRVAKATDVPLGSMTYHFAGKDELLHEAFTRFSTEVSVRFEKRMQAAVDAESARDAVVEIVLEDIFGDVRELVLTHELYTLAAREPRYRRLTTEWMARSRGALECWFDPRTARALDALIEGLTIHCALDDMPRNRDEIASAVARIIG